MVLYTRRKICVIQDINFLAALENVYQFPVPLYLVDPDRILHLVNHCEYPYLSQDQSISRETYKLKLFEY